MSKSIISNDYVCLVCKLPYHLHRHHVFYGTANRKKSEKYGCWVYLCPRHHNASNAAVHANKAFDLALKQRCQEAWEAEFGTRQDFIKVFGRTYLHDEEEMKIDDSKNDG